MLEDFFTDCRWVERDERPNGFGGVDVILTDADAFRGGLVRESGAAYDVAERQGMKTAYTLVTRKNVELRRGSLFRCKGQLFRLTEDGNDIPLRAAQQYRQAGAEVYDHD